MSFLSIDMHCVASDEDVVQCVPTRKGHHILYKGYTYAFKTRLQCGSEQWYCSYRQKTAESEIPEWVSIYYMKTSENEQRCNICESTLHVNDKSPLLLTHITQSHKEVHDLHKDNPDASVGFRIEFLHLNVLKDDGDPKNQPMLIGEVMEATTEEIVEQSPDKSKIDNVEQQVVVKTKRKRVKSVTDGTKILSDTGEIERSRKRSWVWKYFHKMSNIIFRCTLCNVVLSIKGCNTNNMNRHMRTRHPNIFEAEVEKKKHEIADVSELSEVETPYAIKTEEIQAVDKEIDDSNFDSPSQRSRRSWIWLYFTQQSPTSAQCKLCNRIICHGGNATGNMNRHLKVIHNKTPGETDDMSWIWKVFDNSEDIDFYTCKICQFHCIKYSDIEKSINTILHHLKEDHGVVSGDQIITSTEEGEGEEN